MSMKGLKRSIKSSQPYLRKLSLIVDGVPATPVVTGFDEYQIDSIVDNGVGDYTIIFKRPFERACQCDGLVIITPDAIGIVTAVAYDRITVKTFDATDGTTAKDTAFYLNVLGSDWKINY